MTQENRVVFLKGKKVNLRPVMKADLPLITRWINDPEVRYFLANVVPQSLEDEEAWLAGLSKKKDTHVVFVIEKADGQPIGVMGLHGIHHVDRTATTGSFIGEKEYWGKGLGTEAKFLLLDYAFDTLNLRKICSEALAFNERSIRYSLRCGYKEEGRLKDHIFRNGKFHDKVLLAVFREDFVPIWEKHQSEEYQAPSV
ncbi:MAG: GNAT family protein [Patescibacteria group bacterium]